MTESGSPPSADAYLLFASRIIRLFAFGIVSVILALYLAERGMTDPQIGLLLTLTLLGDTAISLWITTRADRMGRRLMLRVGALLMIAAGLVFAFGGSFWVLLVAMTIGVISPSGKEVGPFLPIEQTALAQLLPDERRTGIFAWYNLAGSFATALGALVGGGVAGGLQNAGYTALASYQVVIVGYTLAGLVMLLLIQGLSPAVEVIEQPADSAPPVMRGLGLTRSRGIVLRLSALFAMDAFGGGFVVQSIVAYWFYLRFDVSPAVLGGIFFGANLLAGISALLAVRLAKRFGLINTMVFTHIPSNILLMLIPFMPTLPLAIGLLLIRFSISQMDVPTRQSYTMAVVDPAERSAASGITGVARTIGAGLAPVFTGLLLANPALLAAPFLIAGVIKISYDSLLFLSFRRLKPPEERPT